MEIVDDSFKKPGAIPFKWEIRPGVPKLPQHYDENPVTPRKLTPPPPSAVGYCSQTGSFRSTAPPPPVPRSGSSRCRSFRFYYSSNNNYNDLPQQRNVGVSTTSGCFPSPLLIKRSSEKKKSKKKHKITRKEEETASNSDVEILSPRLSVSSCRSSWKSLSPLRDSPLSSSFSSYSYQYLTPPPPPPAPRRRLGKLSNDAADWASFGLF